MPVEVTTDRAPAYSRVLDELVPTAMHDTAQYANNRVEADHGRLKARLRPMRGLKTFRSARILATGHAFGPEPRTRHYDIATDEPAHRRLLAAFEELGLAILTSASGLNSLPADQTTQQSRESSPCHANTSVQFPG